MNSSISNEEKLETFSISTNTNQFQNNKIINFEKSLEKYLDYPTNMNFNILDRGKQIREIS